MAMCTNCPRIIKTGGARGWCARCYKYQQVHDGELPPPEGLRDGGQTVSLTIRLAPSLRKRANKKAGGEGKSLSEAVRELLEGWT